MNNDFWQESAKAKHDMTIQDLLELGRLKRLAERKVYESPMIFDLDNPYGPSGIYDERAIPSPYSVRKERFENE